MSFKPNGEVSVPDLGADKIWRIVNDGAPGKFREKTSTLTAQRTPEAPNGATLPLLANVSVVPANPLKGSSFAAAEILISTPAKQTRVTAISGRRSIARSDSVPNQPTRALGFRMQIQCAKILDI
ncbi:uncharacterized protein EV420DRAFT_1484770 [Desarmillaria tabescens]|uniref:Uncharacterized protein n=1 Tax=Armillaria tabescens TaxID=1929756 RepID=A0AA39MRE4_ARMTA|nr:uncharacterized protein EV420DRAFT_1484770 [Desarmillaria tabescens]KAK0444286.1 hypothetical protein EV420DRAFT_1484770 [Desarmillaria tabescens]